MTVGQWSVLTALILIWIGVLCHLCRAKNCRNIAVLTKFAEFGGSCAHPLTDPSQIWQETVDWSMLTCQISFKSIYCVNFQGRKTTLFGKFWHLGAPVPPLLLTRAKYGVLRSTLTCQISSWSVYSVARWKQIISNFTILSTLVFCGVAKWWHTNKFERECKSKNLPLLNGIKIVSVFQWLHGEIVRINSAFNSIMSPKQTKNSTFLVAVVAGEVRASPNLAKW